MIQVEVLKSSLIELNNEIIELRASLDLEKMKADIRDLDEKILEDGFWNDNQKAQKIVQEASSLKEKVKSIEDVKTQYEDLNILLELSIEEKDEASLSDVKTGIEELEKTIKALKLQTLLDGEYDKNNAILSIHSGAGGLDAQDWAEMLMRMYVRWCERRGFKVNILDILSDTEGGIKSVTMMIKGDYAYGYLKSEKGVHRLVRISPFDSSGKRHTSFASIDVMPDISDDIDIVINPNDIRVDTYRASGAGGQHINKTDSAIRLTHIPTGIVVQCQNERSQHSNKATAMKMLMAKLIELKELENKEKIEDLQGNYNQIAWGSQIRSYVFHPYTMAKDHRTNLEIGNINSVMDGDIDAFINEYLKKGAVSK
ncbi:peptide chain release factor 2 [Abyssisolibacter fermentans]|uniref:peptide chain release factor 2 n=1 Tax=Abyssisolibacter fermentans TaxID=1766203 RepID=UPI00192E756F|nr:peptide chain release factor 2 [Abyssisolibacter fermentans]